MSGYSSRAEVVAAVRATIENDTNRTGLPCDPAAYSLAAIVRENFRQRGAGYGWGATTDADQFVASLRRNLRRPPATTPPPVDDVESLALF